MSTHIVTETTRHGLANIETVICDGCGRQQTADGLTRWVVMEQAGINVATMGDLPGPLHACTTDCAYDALEAQSWISALPEGEPT